VTTFLVTLAFFALVIAAMSVGAVFAGRHLKGSCGGVGGADCVCGPEKRKECKSKKGVAHADVPIDPNALSRKS
jgi:hypothetical protein